MNKVVRFNPTLEDHLNECEQRYQGLVESIDKVDVRLERVERILIELKEQLNQKLLS